MKFYESDIERKMVMRFRNAGLPLFKFVSPGNDGVPDRIAVLPGGRIIFIELKTETGHLAKIQELQLRRLRKLGCDCRVIKGTAEAEAFMKEVIPDEVQSALISDLCDTEDP